MISHGINSKVPNEEAELVLLEELYKAGGELDTADLVERAMSHFPILQTLEEMNRSTPSGRPWWPGRFRFDLSRLKNLNRETQNIVHGRWRITQMGIDRLMKSGYPVTELSAKVIETKEESAMSKEILTSKLIEVWMEHAKGTKTEISQQVSERLFGLLSLAALPETKPLFDKLAKKIDFDELCNRLGSKLSPRVMETKKNSAMSKETVTYKLMAVWMEHTKGSKAELAQQAAERIFGLLSLAALPETEQIYNQLETILNFDELCDGVGSLSICGFTGGSRTLLDLF